MATLDPLRIDAPERLANDSIDLLEGRSDGVSNLSTITTPRPLGLCITTRHQFQARQVEHMLCRAYPQYKTEREGRSVRTDAPAAVVREVANACLIAGDSRWITVVA